MKIGVLADIHGDLAAFNAALRILDREGAAFTVCAGDIVERGADADEIVRLIRARNISCIKGNHEHSLIRNQARWREADAPERMAEIGRVVTDETLAYVDSLPDSAQYTLENTRITMAHGTPWSDMIAIYPNTRKGMFDQLYERYNATTDIMILGHSHQPMCVRIKEMLILNPGSVYGVTIRDSHTCAILTLPAREFQVFDLHTAREIEVTIVDRSE